MTTRRFSLFLSLPLALGLMGCPQEEDGGYFEGEETDRTVEPQPYEDDGTIRDTDEGLDAPGVEDDLGPTPGDRDPTGIPPVPNESADPMNRQGDFDRGAETGPQQTQPDQTQPGGD